MAVLDGIKGFDWDLHNAGHVARHGVNPTEVEEALERPHVIIPAKSMAMNQRERRIYAPEINKKH